MILLDGGTNGTTEQHPRGEDAYRHDLDSKEVERNCR
jgi:hypothetical protein